MKFYPNHKYFPLIDFISLLNIMQIHYVNTKFKSIIKYYKKNYAASVFGVGQRLVDKKKEKTREN